MLTLITGAGAKGQVGEAVARALAARGDEVLIVARSESDAAARAAEMAAEGHNVHGYGCDLASDSDVDRLAARIHEEHGDRLDALVNLAGGFALSGPLAESDPALLARMFEINVRTAYLTTRAFIPSLRVAQGSVVYFASDAVLDGSRVTGIAAYVAAKSAVVALMRSVADEAAGDGVRANALAPGAIRTTANVADMGDQMAYVEREEVGAAVAWLCSPDSAAVTGQVIRLRPVTR
jgi:NAD(P)-dependent dehydrogenase (short-subunit alcohol dehydrogenase family)